MKLAYSDEEKKLLLKSFTKVLKDANGKGPRNIYIRYESNGICIVMQGVVSDFEKHLIKNFGQEAIDILTDFYERDSVNTEKVFLEILGGRYNFKFDRLESNFIKDEFNYYMKLEDRDRINRTG